MAKGLTLSPSVIRSVDRAIFDFFVKQAKLALIVEAPVLANPFLEAILDYLLKVYGDKLFELLNNYITFAAIDFNSRQQQDAFQKALEQLIAVQEAKNATKRQLDQASKLFDDAMAHLVRFDI